MSSIGVEIKKKIPFVCRRLYLSCLFIYFVCVNVIKRQRSGNVVCRGTDGSARVPCRP